MTGTSPLVGADIILDGETPRSANPSAPTSTVGSGVHRFLRGLRMHHVSREISYKAPALTAIAAIARAALR
jgi:hypothetical protein